MGEEKLNIVYGDVAFEKLFKTLIDDKINNIIYKVKHDNRLRYNNSNYLSTKELNTEVENNE